MKDMIVPEGLEILLESNIDLKDLNKSIKKLKVAFVEDNPQSTLVISPYNRSGMLGFEFNGNSLESMYHVQGVSLDSPGVTRLDMGDDVRIVIHTRKKTWPKYIDFYGVIDSRYYFSLVGIHKGLRSEN